MSASYSVFIESTVEEESLVRFLEEMFGSKFEHRIVDGETYYLNEIFKISVQLTTEHSYEKDNEVDFQKYQYQFSFNYAPKYFQRDHRPQLPLAIGNVLADLISKEFSCETIVMINLWDVYARYGGSE